ncbi:MAG: hypothetical protein IM631_12190 [Cytophagales bacterium]|nr:hypothetical protein [Cytophagales bacterium]MCA6372130.1 hypothetical protein [Cytophagales bacterium]MCA6382274.1 hypothetical protein [Cytophagales bacterium]
MILYNPNNINAVLLSSGDIVELLDDQGFQEYPNRIELWQGLSSRLSMVGSWNKTQITMIRYGTSKDASFELPIDYELPNLAGRGLSGARNKRPVL